MPILAKYDSIVTLLRLASMASLTGLSSSGLRELALISILNKYLTYGILN